MAEEKYNRKNSAVKWILQEVKEMQANPSDDFMSLFLEENIFEWQFAIRGPRDTEFKGGVYHGRIQLPAGYPFKLSSNEHWCIFVPRDFKQVAVRTALMALIAFMPTSPNGALGSLDYPKEERRVLALNSREAAPKFGTPERQRLIDEIHAYMMSKAHHIPEPKSPEDSVHPVDTSRESLPGRSVVTGEELRDLVVADEINRGEAHEVPINPNPTSNLAGTGNAIEATARGLSSQPLQRGQKRGCRDQLMTDALMWAAIGLTIGIMVFLLKKFIKSSDYGALFVDGS